MSGHWNPWNGSNPFDDDDPEEEPPPPKKVPLRRAPCPMCMQKGWIWELVTSVRT